MATLSAVQVAALAYMAGWREKEIAEAVAVAKGESGYRTDAANSCCVGLWQVNLKAHGVSAEDMKDPAKNAAKAYAIYKSAGGWCTRGKPPNCNPWQAYGKGNWNGALSEGTRALASLKKQMASGKTPADIANSSFLEGLGEGITSSIPGADTAAVLTAFVDALNRVGAWISDPENWVRIVKVMGGVTIVIVGGAVIAKDPIVSGLRTAKKVKRVVL